METCVAKIAIVLLVWQTTADKLEDKTYWYKKGKEQIRRNEVFFSAKDYGNAKNVIIFIGDGMGLSTVTAARMYKNLEGKRNGDTLFFEKFPYIGTMRTYSVDHYVTDGAASATAMFTGNINLTFEGTTLLEKYPSFFFCGNLVDFNESRLHAATLNLHMHA